LPAFPFSASGRSADVLRASVRRGSVSAAPRTRVGLAASFINRECRRRSSCSTGAELDGAETCSETCRAPASTITMPSSVPATMIFSLIHGSRRSCSGRYRASFMLTRTPDRTWETGYRKCSAAAAPTIARELDPAPDRPKDMAMIWFVKEPSGTAADGRRSGGW